MSLNQEARKLYVEASNYNANGQVIGPFLMSKIKIMICTIIILENGTGDGMLYLDGRDDLLAYADLEVDPTKTYSAERNDAIRGTLKIGDKEFDLFSDFLDLSKYGATKHVGPVLYVFDQNDHNETFNFFEVRAGDFTVDIKTHPRLMHRINTIKHASLGQLEDNLWCVSATNKFTDPGSYLLEIPADKKLSIAKKILDDVDAILYMYRS